MWCALLGAEAPHRPQGSDLMRAKWNRSALVMLQSSTDSTHLRRYTAAQSSIPTAFAAGE
jgi:hypothetical protein